MSLKNGIHSNSIEPMIAGFFTTTEIASIFLLSLALIFLLRSKQFITKRTLLQYLIISILQKISIVLVLILYSASSSSYSDNNPALYCIIQAYFSGFLEYGIAMIPAVLSIYLCFAILKNTDVERQVFVTMTSVIWLVAIIGTLAQIVGSLEQPSTGVRFNLDGCALTAGELGKWKLWSAVPILVFASVGLVFSVMSLYGLFSIWRRQIERTVLKSLYAVILMVACLILTLTRVILNLQSIHHLSDSHQNLWSANYALKFVLAVFGPILYTIYISLQTNTCLCIHFPCNTKETEEDDDLEEIVSWPSSLTLTDQQHGQQKTVDQEEGTAPMQKLELGKSFKESMVIVLR